MLLTESLKWEEKICNNTVILCFIMMSYSLKNKKTQTHKYMLTFYRPKSDVLTIYCKNCDNFIEARLERSLLLNMFYCIQPLTVE